MMTAMTTVARRRMAVEQRREHLISVALDLFSHRPPDAVSIEDIAGAAGISRPLVYHYFPGKQSLYEAALRRSADELTALLREPREGPLGPRLLRVLRRFFDFVEAHGPGFAALMRGGPAAAGPGVACAMIDEVREAAYEQMLLHLGVAEPGARLELTVRSWISLAETTALLWLNGLRIPREELELQLVHDVGALLAVSAAFDGQVAGVLARWELSPDPGRGYLRLNTATVRPGTEKVPESAA